MKTDFMQRTFSEPAEGQVLIRVVSSAICGSDLHIFKGRHPAVPLPVTIGHEFSGDIVAVGPGVTGLSEGDRVTLEPCIVCGTCEACRHGNYGYCENISFSYRKGDGAMDAGNMLKPALARGELHCIGATTLDEYRQYIEKDAALERRFQKVFVGEPTVEDTIAILRGLKEPST
mgnify:CR=1 FL=1